MKIAKNFCVWGHRESDFEVCTYFACKLKRANLFNQSLYDSSSFWLNLEFENFSFLYLHIFCLYELTENLFSPDQCLYDFWGLWFDFHFDILLLQFRRLVRRVQLCLVDGVSEKIKLVSWFELSQSYLVKYRRRLGLQNAMSKSI